MTYTHAENIRVHKKIAGSIADPERGGKTFASGLFLSI